jgi:hypothetical protein
METLGPHHHQHSSGNRNRLDCVQLRQRGRHRRFDRRWRHHSHPGIPLYPSRTLLSSWGATRSDSDEYDWPIALKSAVRGKTMPIPDLLRAGLRQFMIGDTVRALRRGMGLMQWGRRTSLFHPSCRWRLPHDWDRSRPGRAAISFLPGSSSRSHQGRFTFI